MKTANGDSEPPIMVPESVAISDLSKIGLQTWKHPALDSLLEVRGGFFALNFILGTYLELLDHSCEKRANAEALSNGRPLFRESMAEVSWKTATVLDRLGGDLESIDANFAEEKLDHLDPIRESWAAVTSESLFEELAKPTSVRAEIEDRVVRLTETTQELEVLYFETCDRIALA